MMSPIEQLCRLRKELENPDKWWDGSEIHHDPNKHCIITCLHNIGEPYSRARYYLENIAKEPLDSYNDNHSHNEIIELIDKGIEHFKQQDDEDMSLNE